MSDTFYQKAITIEEAGFENNRYKIKADKLSYSFFKTKKDGTESKAYISYSERKPQIGDKVGIVYTESPAPQGGKYRNIIEFKDPNEVKDNSPVQVPSIPASKKESTDWDKISWGKCKHAFLLKVFEGKKLTNEIELNAEEWADASMRRVGVELKEETPELDVNDLPF